MKTSLACATREGKNGSTQGRGSSSSALGAGGVGVGDGLGLVAVEPREPVTAQDHGQEQADNDHQHGADLVDPVVVDPAVVQTEGFHDGEGGDVGGAHELGDNLRDLLAATGRLDGVVGRRVAQVVGLRGGVRHGGQRQDAQADQDGRRVGGAGDERQPQAGGCQDGGDDVADYSGRRRHVGRVGGRAVGHWGGVGRQIGGGRAVGHINLNSNRKER